MLKEMSQKLPYLLALLLSSCSTFEILDHTYEQRFPSKFPDIASVLELQSQELAEVDLPSRTPVVAVYPNSFLDQTGQRKSNSEFAMFSSAITQAPNSLLIRALKHAGDGKFFRVVERVGLDNLTKERQIIRTTRQAENQKDLNPLIFAGILMEGAVVSYDTNLKTGGIGARYLGIGTSKFYREDTVSVSLRMVSVSTGEILTEVFSQKTIWSYGSSQDLFKFYEAGTELVEVEAGVAENESKTLALMKAIEGAVLQTIEEGYLKGYWKKL